jgi:hypothetical protein
MSHAGFCNLQSVPQIRYGEENRKARARTKELFQVVLKRGAGDENAAGAAQGQEGLDGHVAGRSLEAVALVAHQHVHATGQGLCMLPQRLIGGHQHLPERTSLEVQHLRRESEDLISNVATYLLTYLWCQDLTM